MDLNTDANEALLKESIHKEWINAYRNEKNEIFFKTAFKKILSKIDWKPESSLLDAGCGSANHSIRFAKMGLKNITAIDFSKDVLEIAKQKIKQNTFENHISLAFDDVTNLQFESDFFDITFSWGVLMHVPNAYKGIEELCRVTRKGGYLVISEANKNSIQEKIRRMANRLVGKNNHLQRNTDLGIENWYNYDGNSFLVRQIDPTNFIKEFAKHDCVCTEKFSGQFSEAFIVANSSFIKNFIHAFNGFWFNFINVPSQAYGNIFIFRKH